MACSKNPCFKFRVSVWIEVSWVPEVFLAYGRNFRRWPKADTVSRSREKKLFERVTVKTWQKPETALEKSLAPRVGLRLYLPWQHYHTGKTSWKFSHSSFFQHLVRRPSTHNPCHLKGESENIKVYTWLKLKFSFVAQIHLPLKLWGEVNKISNKHILCDNVLNSHDHSVTRGNLMLITLGVLRVKKYKEESTRAWPCCIGSTNNLVAVNPGDNLRSPTRRSRHVHDHSFIPISTSATSHRLSFYPRTIVQ